MKRAILILDKIPKTCDECTLFVDRLGESFCPLGVEYTDEEIEAEEDANEKLYYHGCLSKRPKECPLKEDKGGD